MALTKDAHERSALGRYAATCPQGWRQVGRSEVTFGARRKPIVFQDSRAVGNCYNSTVTSARPDKARFLTTQWSVVLAGADHHQAGFREALGVLAQRYRTAMVAYVRAYCGCGEPDAEDITQAFLARWAENGMPGVASDRGRFRSYLRAALRHFIQNRRRAGAAQRRGGTLTVTSIDASEHALPIADRSNPGVDEVFDAAYRRELLAAGLTAMMAKYGEEGRSHYMDAFLNRYVLAPQGREPTYQELAERFDASESDVTNWLAHARRRLRRQITELVRESVADEESFHREISLLFGGRQVRP